jgi:dGTPase
VIKRSDIPKQVPKVLGDSHSKRIDTMVKDLIHRSQEKDLGELCMSDNISSTIYMLRDFLYERVYESDKLIKEFRKAKKVLQDLYTYYLEHVDEIFADIPKEKKSDKHRVVCDFIAGMTDRFALMTYERLFLPQQWTVL